MSKFKKELWALRYEYSLLDVRDCTAEESEEYDRILKKDKEGLPPHIMAEITYANNNGNEHIFKHCENRTDITLDERIEYLQLKQTEHLNSIRKMVMFFVILTCISLAAGVIIALGAFR